MNPELPTWSSRGAFVDGIWHASDASDIASISPIDGAHCVARFAEHAAWIDNAVDAARRAQRSWRATPLRARLAVLERLAAIFRERSEEVAPLIVAEMGKTIAEARVEASALAGKVAITAELAESELAPIALPDPDAGVARWRPLGVFAVVGPFNFPVHLSNGHIVPALLAGNAAILKPSESTPACGEWYVRCWEQAAAETGAPPALVQLLQGGGRTGAALVEHPGIDAVAFTGSYAVGVAIRRATAHQTGKVLALEMGGKNSALVLDDADIDATAAILCSAAFSTTGQRCTATSRVLVAPKVADALTEALREEAAAWTAGDPRLDDTKMGPLATRAAFERFCAAQENTEGLETIVAGGAASQAPVVGGYWVHPAIHRLRGADHPRTREELFGPEILIETVDERDLVERANATPYGLAMSVHTASRARFDALLPELDAGLVNWNRATAGASSRLPFGGLKHSGNGRPAGALALRYCVAPVATLYGS